MAHEDYQKDYFIRMVREANQMKIARDIKNDMKAKDSYHFDKTMLNEGIKFFENGGLLEEAPLELRENKNFIHGYEVAKKRQENRQEVYDLGVQKFVDGVHLGKVSEIYRNNPDFMQGYMDAKGQSLIDGIDWENIPDEFIQEVIFSQEQEEVDKDSKRHR